MTTAYPELGLHVGGQWRRPAGGEDVLNPASEGVLARVPHATAADVDDACAAAAEGFRVWRDTPAEMRAEFLCKAARLLRERVEVIAPVLTLEHGKPLLESRGEILRSAAFIEWCAHEGRRAYGRIVPGAPGMRQLALKKPVGPVAAFTPWNFPLLAPAAKIGGVLAAGCSIIVKAAEETPGGAVALVQCLADAGVPAGVVNLLFGKPAEIAQRLIDSPVIRMVTLTGSVPVGKQLAQMAAARIKPAVMELGGHAPVVVCDDTDPAVAARIIALAKFRNSGQVCVSPSRFYVQERVYEPFVTALATVARSLKIGDGMVEGTQFGPLASRRRVETMERLVADAQACGARLMTGGRRGDGKGFYFQPTVLADVPDQALVMHEEPFGPIAPVTPFADLEEVIARANALPFGLAAYAFTESAARAQQLADRIDCGLMSINHPMGGVPEAPFGGVKESGWGREGGVEGVEAFLVTQFVSHRASLS